MFWNAVNNAAFCFMSKFKYPGGIICMSRQFYNALENEMVGDQWWFLIKENSIRCMKIIIDDNQVLFTIKGIEGDELVITNFNFNKYTKF